MCGIAGIYNLRNEQEIQKMAEAMKHRGPNDEGFYFSDDISLGFKRLSIIDLEKGSQPISNEDGSVWLIFNGEVYNFKKIRSDLRSKGHRFKSHCDAEVVLHLYEEKGERCVHDLNGAFSFAIYDERRSKLFLARDRMGIKPLYYLKRKNKLIFASEIKSILSCKDIEAKVNPSLINDYLSLRYVPGPMSLFKDILKLPAGHTLSVNERGVEVNCYWNPELYSGDYKSDKYYIDKFGEILEDSISMRLMSDVPLGAYLSGGIDSSVIVAVMSKLMSEPVKTFSVGFGEDFIGDELNQARERANSLGCDHSEIKFSPKDFDLFKKIVWHLDEPQGDAIALPTFLLSREASKKVKVALTGEGADEILGGYIFHKVLNQIQLYKKITPKFFRKGFINPLVKIVPPTVLNKFFNYPAFLGKKGRERIVDYLNILEEGDPRKDYGYLASLFSKKDKEKLYSDDFKREFLSKKEKNISFPEKVPYLEKLLWLQYENWLPDNILMRQDKMSMANSLEVRVPFLDHRLVEFLLTAPPHLKVNYLSDKFLLRKYSKKVLPSKVSKVKKNAFYLPVENYFKSKSFKDLLELTLSEKKVKERGYFNYDFIQGLKEKLSKNDFLYAKQLMSLVILELWHIIFIDKEKII